MLTSPDQGTSGATTAEVPVTSVTMPSIMDSTIKAIEVPGDKVSRGAKSGV